MNGNGELVRTTCTNLCWGPKLENTVSCDQIVDDIKNHGSSMMCEMIDTKLEEQMVNSQYYNVSYSLRIIFLVYFIQNVLGVILQIPYLCFKMKKGLFQKWGMLHDLLPMFNIIILILLIFLRTSFTYSVCFCDYKAAFFNLRTVNNNKGYNQFTEADYYCH